MTPKESSWKNSTVLVTGGAGFIGSNIVRYLHDQGCEIVVLDNFVTGHRKNLLSFPGIRIIEGDVRDKNAVDESLKNVDVVFHLAASVGNKRSIEYPLEDAGVNVLGTLRVLEAMRQHGVRRIVASSSAGIYGELKHLPIREDHPAEPDSPYGCTKLCEEKLCLSYAKLYHIHCICLRYFNVYGPNQRFDAYGNVIPIFVFNALRGREVVVFGDGNQTRDFVNVADVAQANIQAALADGVSGAFNVASGTRISINALARMVADEVGTNPTIRYGPARKGDVRDSLADISSARSALGYAPVVQLGNGLREYVHWARTELTQNS